MIWHKLIGAVIVGLLVSLLVRKCVADLGWHGLREVIVNTMLYVVVMSLMIVGVLLMTGRL